MYENMDIGDLFEAPTGYTKWYAQEPLTESALHRFEAELGHALPSSYVELCKKQNGGWIRRDGWLTAIYGIAGDEEKIFGIKGVYDQLTMNSILPKTLLPFGETQSAGHDFYCMDFSSVDENGEPRILLVDTEGSISASFVAESFEKFINMVYNGEEIVQGEKVELEMPKEWEVRQKETPQGGDLIINASIVLGIALVFLIFLIPLGAAAIAIDGAVIAICIALIVYSLLKKKRDSGKNP